MGTDEVTDQQAEAPAVDEVPVNHSAEETLVVLQDGSKVRIRQVHRDDARLLEDGFSRLSAESRRLRFLTEKSRLTPAELHYFTHIDHHNHEAIGARDATDGRGVGVARFIRDPKRPEVAEVAVVVVDDWQGRGLGTELLKRLFERAQEEGVSRFTALVAEDNERIPVLLEEFGTDFTVVEHDAGAVSYEITPSPDGHGGELHHLLRAFSRGDLRAPGAMGDILRRIVPERFLD